MIKTKIVETTEKYDENGNLVERITREETSEDDETRYPFSVPNITPDNPYVPNKAWEPYCTAYSEDCADEGRPVE